MKKGFKILLYGLFAITMVGCGKDPAPSNGKENVVTFNNSEFNITVDDLYETLKDKYATNYLIQEIDSKILNKEYESDEKGEKSVENQLKIYRMYYQNDEQALLEALQSSGYRSIDEFKETLLTNYKRDLATKEYARNEITDSEINKYYENNIYGDIAISHILIEEAKTNDSMTDEEKTEKQKEFDDKVNEIYEKLKSGKTFEEVAKEYSDDNATSSNGGRLGTFTKGEMTKQFNKEFEDAVINLKEKEYTTKTVKTSYGYHIIYKESEKEKPSLETVKQTIIDNLVDDKMNDDSKMQYKALIELRKKYGVKFNDEDINSQYDTAVNNWLYSKDE